MAINGIKELGGRDSFICDDGVERNRKTEILDTNLSRNKLNGKLHTLDRSIEQAAETRVKTAFESCQSRIEEVVNIVIGKKI